MMATAGINLNSIHESIVQTHYSADRRGEKSYRMRYGRGRMREKPIGPPNGEATISKCFNSTCAISFAEDEQRAMGCKMRHIVPAISIERITSVIFIAHQAPWQIHFTRCVANTTNWCLLRQSE